MFDDTIERFSFPAVDRKKLTAACDGGRITPDGGVMLLAAAERRSGIARHLAGLIADTRDPALVTHSLADILRARMLVLSQTSHVDPANLGKRTGLPRQGIKLPRWTRFACRAQLAFADHVHDLDSRQSYCS
jgi:hypothetical protein